MLALCLASLEGVFVRLLYCPFFASTSTIAKYVEHSLTRMSAVYIFIGSVIVDTPWYKWVIGTIVGLIGIGYVALEFVPSIEPPANMRDADPSWGAEQI
jgi:hypothetical protein